MIAQRSTNTLALRGAWLAAIALASTAAGQEIQLAGRDGLPLPKLTGIVAGPDGRREDDGAFFLLPYWLARRHCL